MEDNKELNVTISIKEMTDIVRDSLSASIKKTMHQNQEQIERSLNEYFKKSFLGNKESQFESSLDWTVENCFRLGIEEAMKEMNFKEMIAQKAKELLSSNDFIATLAEKKVRASLGLS